MLIFKPVFYYAQPSNMPTIKNPEVHEVKPRLRVFSSMKNRIPRPDRYIGPLSTSVTEAIPIAVCASGSVQQNCIQNAWYLVQQNSSVPIFKHSGYNPLGYVL